MSLKNEFKKMIEKLSSWSTIPPVSTLFFPPFFKGGQPKDAQFMAMGLEGGAAGVSYVLLPDEKMEDYTTLKPDDFIGKSPKNIALEFGNKDPIKEMISLAAINATCQHVMKTTRFKLESTTDSLGLLAISKGDRIGMVGLFPGLVKTIRKGPVFKKRPILEFRLVIDYIILLPPYQAMRSDTGHKRCVPGSVPPAHPWQTHFRSPAAVKGERLP